MGKIRGDVDVLGIANVLQMLSSNSCNGHLAIQRDAHRKVIQFTPGGMKLISGGANRTRPLGEILLRNGKISGVQLNDILAEQRQSGKRFGDILTQRGMISREEIEAALREQIAEEIYDLFTWQGATFEFDEAEGTPPPAAEAPLAEMTLDVNIMSIVMEAARRADEIARIRVVIPDLHAVPVKGTVPIPFDDPGMDRGTIEAVLPLVDGVRSVERIVEESLFPTFSVLRTLYGLAQRGSISIQDRRPKGRTEARRPAPPIRSRGRTVLLLSELPTFRTALAVCVRGGGFDVIEGQGSADIKSILNRQRADLIVLDISIETDDGLGLCTRVRESTETPFLVLSGNTSKQAVINAVQSGARSVLIKPIKEDVLLERISNVLKG